MVEGTLMAVACTMCGRAETERTILDRLADQPGIDVRIERWPDGAPVVEDSTITPEDFTRGL